MSEDLFPEAPITAEDLQKFDSDLETATAQDMIRTAWVRARRVAPCLKEPEFFDDLEDIELLKDILRGAILRWNERGSGAVTSRNAGEYGETLKADASLFRPQEIRDLQSLCSGFRRRGRASTISTVPTGYGNDVQHAEWCAWNFQANPTFCDCGALLSGDGLPINGGATQL